MFDIIMPTAMGALLLYILWLLYLAVMSLMRARDAGTLSKPAYILGLPALGIGLALNAFVNVTIFSAILLEVPRELTVTSRLQRHAPDDSWRGKIARAIGKYLLDTFDPDGKHV